MTPSEQSVFFGTIALESAGVVQLKIEGGPFGFAVLLSAAEAIEMGTRLHDAANLLEMAEGRHS